MTFAEVEQMAERVETLEHEIRELRKLFSAGVKSPWMGKKEAANYLGISTRTLARRGVKYHRDGKRVFYNIEDLKAHRETKGAY